MGYETKIYVGEDYGISHDGLYGIGDICSLDLCKIYDSEISKVHGSAKKYGKPAYIWASNGNDKITEDCYGAGLFIVPLSDVLEAAKKDAKRDGYRRYDIAVAMLEAVERGFGSKNVGVVFYGH